MGGVVDNSNPRPHQNSIYFDLSKLAKRPLLGRQNYKHSVARGQISMRGAPHGLSVVVDPVFDGQTTKWKKVGFVVGDQCYAQCHGMRGDELI